MTFSQLYGDHAKQHLTWLQVTPMLGLLAATREKLELARANGKSDGYVAPRVIFVWASRDSTFFDLLDDDILAEAG